MRFLGNIIWFLAGGLVMGLLWWAIGLVAFVTVVGIPWARSCFVIGQLSFLPFGKDVIARDELRAEQDIGTGTIGTVGNVIWFFLAGIFLAVGHLAWACVLAVTIIGIPFAIQHLKLAGISLAPVGKTVVSKELAEAARMSNAQQQLDELRSGSN